MKWERKQWIRVAKRKQITIWKRNRRRLVGLRPRRAGKGNLKFTKQTNRFILSLALIARRRGREGVRRDGREEDVRQPSRRRPLLSSRRRRRRQFPSEAATRQREARAGGDEPTFNSEEELYNDAPSTSLLQVGRSQSGANSKKGRFVPHARPGDFPLRSDPSGCLSSASAAAARSINNRG